MSNLWGREPTLIVAAATALISLGVAFGLQLSDEQFGAIMAVVAALLGLLTRARVSPKDTG